MWRKCLPPGLSSSGSRYLQDTEMFTLFGYSQVLCLGREEMEETTVISISWKNQWSMAEFSLQTVVLIRNFQTADV